MIKILAFLELVWIVALLLWVIHLKRQNSWLRRMLPRPQEDSPLGEVLEFPPRGGRIR